MFAHVPVAKSYSSALLKSAISILVPPATKTLPQGSNVAVRYMRAVLGLPLFVHVPAAGSYSSALPMISFPPVTNTLPEASNVAV